MNIESHEVLEVIVDSLGSSLVGSLESIVEFLWLALTAREVDLVDLGLKHG